MLKNIAEVIDESLKDYERLLNVLEFKVKNGELSEEQKRLAKYHCECIEKAFAEIDNNLRGLCGNE